MADDPSKQAARKLLTKAIEFELKAAESVDKDLRWAQLKFGRVCIFLAFVLAFVLITFGPPAPEVAQYSPKPMPSATGEAIATPVQVAGQPIANSTAPDPSTPAPKDDGVQDEDPPVSPEDDPPSDETESSTNSEKSEGDDEDTTTAVLDEQAPWVFAIVALLVGAFLVAGQSISFGGGGKVGEGGQPTPQADDDETDTPGPPADDDQTGTPDPPAPPDGPDTTDKSAPTTVDK